MKSNSNRKRLRLLTAKRCRLRKLISKQKNESNTHDIIIRKSTVAMAWLTGVLAVAAILSAWVSFGQLGAMKDQLNEMQSSSEQTETLILANQSLADAAKKQAIAAEENAKIARDALISGQRAWVGPMNARLEGTPKAGEAIVAKVVVQNTGREPGFSFNFEPQPVVSSETDADLDSKISTQTAWCMSKQQSKNVGVIYPSSTTFGSSAYEYGVNFAADDISEEVITGKKVLLATGCITYESEGSVRHSSFCYFYKAGTSKPDRLNICNGGNEAD